MNLHLLYIRILSRIVSVLKSCAKSINFILGPPTDGISANGCKLRHMCESFVFDVPNVSYTG